MQLVERLSFAQCLLEMGCFNRQAELQECRGSLAAAKAEVGRLRRAAAAEKQRSDSAADAAAALAAEQAARQGAEAAAAGARAALTAKADLIKDLRARVRFICISGNDTPYISMFAQRPMDPCQLFQVLVS